MVDTDTNELTPVEAPVQFDFPQLSLEFIEVDSLVRITEARGLFKVTGAGLGVGVLDTGLNTNHVDFRGRIPIQLNYTSENNGDSTDATDGQGHGTNVTGIIAAKRGDHQGTAPDAQIVPLKVFDNSGNGSFDAVADALEWIVHNATIYKITVVCMSLGSVTNWQDDTSFSSNKISILVKKLKDNRIPVCIAAGNHFYSHGSNQGMAFPGILRDSISVGAVYDANEGAFRYADGAATDESGEDRITPFSQRLHPSISQQCATKIFAPGAPVRSSGIRGPHGESSQQGTSQATPVTAGVILLMQEFYLRETGSLPEVDLLIDWIRRGAVSIFDGDDENDNVKNTKLKYLRLDAVRSLTAVKKEIEKSIYLSGKNASEI